MFLVVGLGNIGEKYCLTRHNVGFMVIDEMTKTRQNLSNINKSDFHSTVIKSQNILFVKPTTYMNNSGVALRAISDYYKIENQNIVVIHDDLDLPFGTIKFKIGGGHGGHNGLKSIDGHIGANYTRVRVGIGKPLYKEDVSNYVLSNFSKEEFVQLEDLIGHIIKAVEAILSGVSIEEIKAKFSLKM